MEEMNKEFDVQEVAEVAEEPAKELYHLADGTECSRAAFIRDQFITFNKSRSDIEKEFGFPYRVVYSATLNLTNSAVTSSRGKATTIKVTVDGEEVEMDRTEYIKKLIADGMSRKDIAESLGISYGAVYNATKEFATSRTVHTITLEDGSVVTRNEYIRQLYADGMSKAEIAKTLDVDYPVVWGALSKDKSDADKFGDAVEKLNRFRDMVVEPETFDELISMLKQLEFKAEIAEEETEEVTVEE